MRLAWVAAFVLPLISSSLSHPQQVSPPATPTNATSSETKAATTQTEAGAASPEAPLDPATGPVTESELRQLLLGKHFYLRGFWLADELHFGLDGRLSSTSAKGSFTLCDVEFDRLRLTRRRLELEGARYGVHFDDAGDWSGQAGSFDRIRITPKKKRFVLTIDRQLVVSPKKAKRDEKRSRDSVGGVRADAAGAAAPITAVAEMQDRTTNPAQADALLRSALDRILAPAEAIPGARMTATLPDSWQYFYQAQSKHQSIEPTDASIVRPGPGVTGPTLAKNLAPASNEYAQHAQIAGIASYKVILDAAGKPLAVAVFRPIGFGLDENAVAAIRHSTFTPARKGGKATASVITLDVSFRILSPQTAAATGPPLPPDVSPMTGKRSLPGPYTADERQ